MADLAGCRFERLVVSGKAHRSNSKQYWHCMCDCGAAAIVETHALRSGKSRSCGCLARETARTQLTTHGFTNHPMHFRWKSMIQRCHGRAENQNYSGRGITVCDRWRFGEDGVTAFECFYADMGDPPFVGATVDRIDNNGGYSPGNCRWADALTQNHNRRPVRRRVYRGADSPSAKLSDAQLVRVRELLAAGSRHKDIAELFGVCRQTISKISAGRTYSTRKDAATCAKLRRAV